MKGETSYKQPQLKVLTLFSFFFCFIYKNVQEKHSCQNVFLFYSHFSVKGASRVFKSWFILWDFASRVGRTTSDLLKVSQ